MRWLYYTISIVSSLLVFIIYQFWPPIIYALFIIIPYILIGIHDIRSVSHTVLRNYPVIGHLRYILEFIRPEIQQYYIETDNSGTPYSRETRSLIYQKAKGEFGKLLLLVPKTILLVLVMFFLITRLLLKQYLMIKLEF